MTIQRSSYTTYSFGVAVTWAIVLAVASVVAPSSKRRDYFVVFGGFSIGWLSATIARWVYAPPKRYQQSAPQTP